MKNSSESHKEIRPINYGELHLIMSRLMFDVLDHSFAYKNSSTKYGEDAITNFLTQENYRRNLFLPVRKVLIEKI